MNRCTLCVFFALASTLVVMGACSSPSGGRHPEAHSLLDGRGLYPPERSPGAAARLESQLAAAHGDYEANPHSEEALIWYGRRLGYLGRYREAIDLLTGGLAQHTDSPRVLRHRGHRYISVREFDRAASDLARAARVIDERRIPDAIEPDGMPNAAGVPRSTLHSNIYYHCALARYLQGQFESALEIWNLGLESIEMNDDMRIAFLYWIHNSLLRLSRPDDAQGAISGVREQMGVLENFAYHRLLLLFKGERSEADFTASITPGDSFDATIAYGVAMHRLAHKNEELWVDLLESILEHEDQWASFGFIAAEADLARHRSRAR